MKYDLQERLIGYSVLILEIINSLPDNKATNHLANQMIRSGTAPCLMYGEAQSSESRKDFIHKMRLPLKELRETYNCLRVLSRMNCQEMPNEGLAKAINETDELIAIFAKSIDTAIKNSNAKDWAGILFASLWTLDIGHWVLDIEIPVAKHSTR